MLSLFSSLLILGSISGYLISSGLSLISSNKEDKSKKMMLWLIIEAGLSIVALALAYFFIRQDKQRYSFDHLANTSIVSRSQGTGIFTGTLPDDHSGFATVAQVSR